MKVIKDINIKQEWIIKYLRNKESLKFVDVLDEDFVINYIEAFDVDFEDMTIGSPKCKELSKILGTMFKNGLLTRHALGVRTGLYQDYKDRKAPKWVYSYQLPNK